MTGADYKVSPDTPARFRAGGRRTGFSLANGLGSGSADVFQAGAYARHDVGPAYLSAALAYGWHDVTTNRTVALAGVDLLQGRFRADTFSGRFEGGYRFATPIAAITPYAAAQVISFSLPAYAEQTLGGRRHVRAELRRADHDRHPQRTRPAQRQIVRHAGRDADAARPRRLGA